MLNDSKVEHDDEVLTTNVISPMQEGRDDRWRIVGHQLTLSRPHGAHRETTWNQALGPGGLAKYVNYAGITLLSSTRCWHFQN